VKAFRVLIAFAFLWLGPLTVLGQQEDPLGSARKLAFSGERAKALTLLEEYLHREPGDTDALTFYGTVLSWEVRYEDARRALRAVLARYPDHEDALAALTNVELWAGNSSLAEELAATALVKRPQDTGLLMARAQALQKLGRNAEAIGALDQLLAIDPDQPQAAVMRADLLESRRRWETMLDQDYEWFSDGRGAWNETEVSLKRGAERAGSVIVRFSHVNQFPFSSNLMEVDAYPVIRKGTYAYLNAGWSPDGVLFSRYRAGAELYQSLPHGIEVSGGYRRLGFSSPVNIYTGSISKYLQAWMFGFRTYVNPVSAGDSESRQFSARRYFGDGLSYVSLLYGTGAAPAEQGDLNEIQVLRSQSVLGEIDWRLARRWTLVLRLGHSVEDRLNLSGLHHDQAEGAFFFRF